MSEIDPNEMIDDELDEEQAVGGDAERVEPAEEAAVHLTDEPPPLDEERYVDAPTER